MKTTINLSAIEIEQIVKEHLEGKGFEVKKTTPVVQKVLMGTQMQEYHSYNFKGIDCEVEI